MPHKHRPRLAKTKLSEGLPSTFKELQGVSELFAAVQAALSKLDPEPIKSIADEAGRRANAYGTDVCSGYTEWKMVIGSRWF